MSRLPEHYPDAPGFKAAGPSKDAAEKIAGRAAILRDSVLKAFATIYPRGMTADEIAGELNQSILSVRPRVTELRRIGAIADAGQRRKNASGMTATVWRYVPEPLTQDARTQNG